MTCRKLAGVMLKRDLPACPRACPRRHGSDPEAMNQGRPRQLTQGAFALGSPAPGISRWNAGALSLAVLTVAILLWSTHLPPTSGPAGVAPGQRLASLCHEAPVCSTLGRAGKNCEHAGCKADHYVTLKQLEHPKHGGTLKHLADRECLNMTATPCLEHAHGTLKRWFPRTLRNSHGPCTDHAVGPCTAGRCTTPTLTQAPPPTGRQHMFYPQGAGPQRSVPPLSP